MNAVMEISQDIYTLFSANILVGYRASIERIQLLGISVSKIKEIRWLKVLDFI
jgi:hypothetical protein